MRGGVVVCRTGGGESVTSSIQFMASGGGVYPGNTYGVAEAGEFEIFQPKGPGTIALAHNLGSRTYNCHVDARGADLGVAERVEAAMRAAHNSPVEQGVKASAERTKRSPQRSSQFSFHRAIHPRLWGRVYSFTLGASPLLHYS